MIDCNNLPVLIFLDCPHTANPKCEKAGCGEWKAPLIDNPAYKGKWSPPLIDNPSYKVH